MIDRLASVRTFVRAVELGSFSAAARELSLTQPTVSKQIAALEDALGARLLTRTTRALSLTNDGERYYRHIRAALEAFEEAAAEIRAGAEPTGHLKVACGLTLGRHKVTPLLRGFLQRYPGITLELDLSDRFVNLVEEGVDVAIRVGVLRDSGLVARRVGVAARACVAAPDYLARLGTPLEPHDLLDHNCLVYTIWSGHPGWHFRGPSGPITVKVSGQFRSNSPEAIRQLVLAGEGIGLLASWLYADDVAAGRLVQLLDGYEADALPIHAVTVGGRLVPGRVRALIGFLADAFRLDPALSVRSSGEMSQAVAVAASGKSPARTANSH
jgi:DNA-binding transcriptional LysR family regulator